MFVVWAGRETGRDSLRLRHVDVAAKFVVEGRVELADRGQAAAAAGDIAALLAAVLGLELRDAVFEIADVFNRGLQRLVVNFNAPLHIHA